MGGEVRIAPANCLETRPLWLKRRSCGGHTGIRTARWPGFFRKLALSGEGFSLYEKACRPSYPVCDRLHTAGISVKVRAIIAIQGSIPDRGDSKAAVMPVYRGEYPGGRWLSNHAKVSVCGQRGWAAIAPPRVLGYAQHRRVTKPAHKRSRTTK